MITAKQLIQATADAIAAPYPTIEAYGAKLRDFSWWHKTKRGRGANPATTMDAAKLLIAILADGPKALSSGEGDPLARVDGTGFFIRTANMRMTLFEDAKFAVLQTELGLSKADGFLDVVNAVLAHAVTNADGGIFAKNDFAELEDPNGKHGLDLEFQVMGPFPMAKFRFRFADRIAEKLIANGMPGDEAFGYSDLHFLHQIAGWHHDALETGRDASSYVQILREISRCTARGLKKQVGFGGYEIEALASVFRASGGAD